MAEHEENPVESAMEKSNKKISAGVLGGATAIWVLFELVEYHLLTLVCHALILALAILFLWSNAHTFINKAPPCILEELKFVFLRSHFCRFLLPLGLNSTRLLQFCGIVSGRDLKSFLIAIAA